MMKISVASPLSCLFSVAVKTRMCSLVLAAFAVSMTPAFSASILVDFNDLTGGGASLSGQGGSSGFSGNWSLGTGPKVNSGDLTSSNYTLTQTGTALSAQSNANVSNNQQAGRTFTTGMGGTIWFSFLGQITDSTDRVAFTLNPTTGAGADAADFIFIGSNFAVRRTGSSNVNIGSATVGTTYLILGQLIIDQSGSNESLKVWFNPNLTSYTSESAFTTAVTPGFNNVLPADFITTGMSGLVSSIGVQSYDSGGGDGGILDAVRISNDANAFDYVTGVAVPEPATIAYLVAGMGLLLLVQRQRRIQ